MEVWQADVDTAFCVKRQTVNRSDNWRIKADAIDAAQQLCVLCVWICGWVKEANKET